MILDERFEALLFGGLLPGLPSMLFHGSLDLVAEWTDRQGKRLSDSLDGLLAFTVIYGVPIINMRSVWQRTSLRSR